MEWSGVDLHARLILARGRDPARCPHRSTQPEISNGSGQSRRPTWGDRSPRGPPQGSPLFLRAGESACSGQKGPCNGEAPWRDTCERRVGLLRGPPALRPSAGLPAPIGRRGPTGPHRNPLEPIRTQKNPIRSLDGPKKTHLEPRWSAKKPGWTPPSGAAASLVPTIKLD